MNKIKPTVMDRVIGFFSPQSQLKRIVVKEKIARKYEAATTSRRTVGWSTSNASSQKETFQNLDKLRERSRDLIQNNAYAKRGADSVVANVVGRGILAQITDSKSAANEKKVNALWKNWAESTECDFDGSKTFYGIQSLVERSIFENGEVLIVRRYLNSKEYKYAPISLQLFEPDHLDTKGYYSKPKAGNKLIQGIEYDQKGKRVAYHLFVEHPGGFSTSRETVRIIADDVCHVFPELRIGQARGIPHLAPAIIKIKDFDEYEDAQLVRQKISACFAGFIRDLDMPEDGDYGDTEQELLEKIEPGTLEVLPPGKSIEFATPPSVEGYSEYAKNNIRGVACALGVSYEALSMDYSNVNFSSGRMGWIEMHRTIEDMRYTILIPKLLNRVADWFFESISYLGYNVSNLKATWTPPKREMIDPASEIPATVDGIRAGLITYSEALQSLGKDPEEHMERIKKDFEKIDQNGLVLDSDPRRDIQPSKKTRKLEALDGTQSGNNVA